MMAAMASQPHAPAVHHCLLQHSCAGWLRDLHTHSYCTCITPESCLPCAVQAPHVFFAGNQPEFSAKVLQGGHCL